MTDTTMTEGEKALTSTHHERRPRPEIGSFRYYIHKPYNTRLFIHPVEWASRHLKLLGVNVVTPPYNTEQPPVPSIRRNNIQAHTNFVAILDLLKYFNLIDRDEHMRRVIKSAAQATGLNSTNGIVEGTLALSYNKHRVARIPTHTLALQATANRKSVPIWAYTDSEHVSSALWKQFEVRKTPLATAWGIVKSKEGLVIDPVYVAILIAQAQRRRKCGERSGCYRTVLFVPENEIIESTPQMNNTTDNRYMARKVSTKLIQYTADIPYEYLNKFEEPSRYFNVTLQIEKKVLPTDRPDVILEAIGGVLRDFRKD